MFSLSYDKVSIIPSFSNIENKDNITLSSLFSTNITLSIPISSNPQITNDKLAISMAKNGGIGIIHRNCSIEDQVSMVKNVKSKICFIIEHPYTITINHDFNYVRRMGEKLNINIFPIIDPSSRTLKGVIDLKKYKDIFFTDETPIEHFNDNNSSYEAPWGIDIKSALELMQKYDSRFLTLIDDRKFLKGLIFRKDIERIINKKMYTIDQKFRFRCGASIGVSDGVERAKQLINAEVDVLVLENPHAHHQKVLETLKIIKSVKGCPDVVVGDVYTPEATNELIKSGADGIKIGTFSKNTSMLSGIEPSQLDSLIKCSSLGVPIIADGDFDGIIGNMFKALAIGGASCCMINKMLLGTKESIGELVIKDGKKYKMYKSQPIPFKGFVHNVIHKIIDGFKMSMSYCGSRSLDKLKVQYIIS